MPSLSTSAKARSRMPLTRCGEELPRPDAAAGEEPSGAVRQEDVGAAVAVEVSGCDLGCVVDVVVVSLSVEVELLLVLAEVLLPTARPFEGHGSVEVLMDDEVVVEIEAVDDAGTVIAGIARPPAKHQHRPGRDAVLLLAADRVVGDQEILARIAAVAVVSGAMDVEVLVVIALLLDASLQDVVEAGDVAAIGLAAAGHGMAVCVEDVAGYVAVRATPDDDPVAAAVHDVVVHVVADDANEIGVGAVEMGPARIPLPGVGHDVGPDEVDAPARPLVELVVGNNHPAAELLIGVLDHRDRMQIEGVIWDRVLRRRFIPPQMQALDPHVVTDDPEEGIVERTFVDLGLVLRVEQGPAAQLAALAHQPDARM